ncbi:MAG: hypothetical protein ACK5WR_09085 [Planctomycetaceae bacterium]
MLRAGELVRSTPVGRWSACWVSCWVSFWTVVCAMCWLVKHILLVVVAVQLAAPAGWCCRLTPAAACETKAAVRRCCAQHGPAEAPLPVSANFCCCPKAATLAKTVEAPGTQGSAEGLRPEMHGARRFSSGSIAERSLHYAFQAISRQGGSRHVELCLWLC